MPPLLALVLAAALADGDVRDASTGRPVAGVVVRALDSAAAATRTDSLGRWSLDVESTVRLRFERAGYLPLETRADSAATVALVPLARSLEGVVVRAVRADEAAPISQTVVPRARIEQGYFGQEMPLILAATPSVTAYSDAGSYAGYSYIRLRGIDQTRINITLDGVPLNEPEDQGLFFQNFPDFANSVESVQIQRGVGTSTNGTAAFAGSINFESPALSAARRGAELQVTGGSWGTRRGALEGETGLLDGTAAVYARVSAQTTEGYRRHSGNDSRSAFASGAWFGARDVVKVTAFDGVARNSMAYVAASEEELRRDPRANPLSPEERDRFGQRVGIVRHTRALSEASSLSTTAYAQHAAGDYDVRIGEELWNFNIASDWYGLLSNWSLAGSRGRLDVGAHASRYRRDHFQMIRPDLGTRLYDNRGVKTEASAFAKGSWEAGRFTLFADLQARRARFRYEPDADAGIGPDAISWTFANPKAGVTVRLAPTLSAFASFGRTTREPARNDMFAGFDNIDTSNAEFVGRLDRVRPERVDDFEAGIEHRGGPLWVRLDVFSMRFRDEIAPIGALSYIGLPLRKNVASSARRGAELDLRWRASRALSAEVAATVMRGRIDEYTDDATGETFRDVEPLLTPRVVASHTLRWSPAAWLELSGVGRWVGRSFLSNTGDDRFVLPASYVADAGAAVRIRRQELLVQLNNLANRRAFAGGYTDGSTSYYYPVAGRNVFATFRVLF